MVGHYVEHNISILFIAFIIALEKDGIYLEIAFLVAQPHVLRSVLHQRPRLEHETLDARLELGAFAGAGLKRFFY